MGPWDAGQTAVLWTLDLFLGLFFQIFHLTYLLAWNDLGQKRKLVSEKWWKSWTGSCVCVLGQGAGMWVLLNGAGFETGLEGDSDVQFSSVSQSCLTHCDPMNHSMPGLPVHHQLLEFTQTHVHWVGDAIQPSHPLSSLSPPAFNLSQPQVLSNESVLRIRWPKSWSFSFNSSASNEHTGLISFRMDWLDLLAVQGTLKNLLQHHSSKLLVPYK